MRASRGRADPRARAVRGGRASGRSRFDRGRSPRDGWQVPRIIRGDPPAGRGRAVRGPRRRPARSRTRPAARSQRSRSSWATIGASASTTRANPSMRTTRHAPAAGGTRSATSASNVAIARRQPELVLEPERARRVRDAGRRDGPSAAAGVMARPAVARGARTRRLAAATSRRGRPRPCTSQRRPDRAKRRVEVVERRGRHERLRQGRDPPDEVGAPLRVELGEHVVEQEQRRRGRRARSAGRARRA